MNWTVVSGKTYKWACYATSLNPYSKYAFYKTELTKGTINSKEIPKEITASDFAI